MKQPYILSLLALLLFSNCTKEAQNDDLIGRWTLTYASIGAEVDINNDGVYSMNLLDEIDCNFVQTIEVQDNGLISLTSSQTPFYHIVKNSEEEYNISVTCNEGILSSIDEYTREGNMIHWLDGNYNLEGKTLTNNSGSKLEVYNEGETEVVETKTVTLIYKKE